MGLDFGSGEIITFSKVALDSLILRNDIDIVLNRSDELEIVA